MIVALERRENVLEHFLWAGTSCGAGHLKVEFQLQLFETDFQLQLGPVSTYYLCMHTVPEQFFFACD